VRWFLIIGDKILRILHVIPYMHARAGGPPVAVEKFVEESKGFGCISEIVTTSLFCDGDSSVLLEHLNRIATTTCLVQRGPGLFFSQTAGRKIVKKIRLADIVHVHTLWNPINTLVRRGCATNSRPYVLMPHGMLDPYSLNVKRWRKSTYLWAIERKNLAAAQRLIYTTAEEAELAARQIPYLPKGVVVPLGADAPAEKVENLAAQFFSNFPVARGRRQVLFLGRLDFKKGLDRIFAILPSVLNAFPDLLFTIVGGGSRSFVRSLEKKAAAYGFKQNVLMTGMLNGPLKWGAYASAELFVLPSRQENFAITVAEAMQIGLPVIISDRVNSWPYVKEAGAGLVLEDDGIEANLGNSLLSLLRNPFLAGQMGRRGREYARKSLTWTRATACLLSCYEEVLTEWSRICAGHEPLSGICDRG
jgi:glycosyltransferase involved in cell wall biosynthesis